MKHFFTRIIRARAYKGAHSDYFTSSEDLFAGDIERLKSCGWIDIEVRHISKRDPKEMAALNKCSLGSKNEHIHLMNIFNDNAE